MSQMLALVILVAILYIGDVVSVRTKAWIPSVFVCAVLFLLGYWTFFPQDIVSLAGVPPAVASMMIYLLITNMGTLLSLQQLKEQWKTILISLAGILGIVVALFGIGTLLFDIETVIVAIPPLVGGVVSALIMSEGAADAGLATLAVFAIVIYVMQGFAGYPLTSIVLKKEGKMLLEKYRKGELKDEKPVLKLPFQNDMNLSYLSNMPEKYNTDYFKFFRLAFVGYPCVSYFYIACTDRNSQSLCALLIIRYYRDKCRFFGTSSTAKSKWFWNGNPGTYAVRF